MSVTRHDVLAAREIIAGRVHRTPVFPSTTLGDRIGGRAFLKAELFQKTGSFKPRGVLNKLASLTPEEKARGVVTWSAGNHAQAVGWAATSQGIDCLVVMSAGANPRKVAATRGYGATVDLEAPDHAAAHERLLRLIEETGRTYVPPYDDPHVIAGQGTVGLEIAQDVPNVAAVFVPIGGGGLASGVAAAVKALVPTARLIGVEPELAADARDSLAAGEIVRWAAEDVSRTIADGTRTQALGKRTFAHIRTHLERIVTVSEEEIAAAVRLAAERSRLVVEPSGALGIAALTFHAGELGLEPTAGPTVAVVSGGNVDPDRYRELLAAHILPER